MIRNIEVALKNLMKRFNPEVSSGEIEFNACFKKGGLIWNFCLGRS